MTSGCLGIELENNQFRPSWRYGADWNQSMRSFASDAWRSDLLVFSIPRFAEEDRLELTHCFVNSSLCSRGLIPDSETAAVFRSESIFLVRGLANSHNQPKPGGYCTREDSS